MSEKIAGMIEEMLRIIEADGYKLPPAAKAKVEELRELLFPTGILVLSDDGHNFPSITLYENEADLELGEGATLEQIMDGDHDAESQLYVIDSPVLDVHRFKRKK